MKSLAETNRTLLDVQMKFDSTHAQNQTLQSKLDESIQANKLLSEKLDKVNKQISLLESRVSSLQNEADVKVNVFVVVFDVFVFEPQKV